MMFYNQTKQIGAGYLLKQSVMMVTLLSVVLAAKGLSAYEETRPNFVFMIADDWSFPHAGALGDDTVKTPVYDRLVEGGIHFKNAFVSAPSCSPCRASILAGQHHWRLQTAANLGGSLHAEIPIFTDLLRAQGYLVAKMGKGHWPANHSYRPEAPLGQKHVSLSEVLEKREKDQPFFYWFGGGDPHRPYEAGIGSGIDPAKVQVPKCLPDTPEVRSDLCDYYWEVQRFDRKCGELLEVLDAAGELDNTLIVMTSDNGMPFPRAKATLYDLGVRVPLVVKWPRASSPGREVTDFVSLHDFAPTFLELAGISAPKEMNGRSLLKILQSDKGGRVDPSRSFAVCGMERHVESNPQRAIHTDEYLLIRNDAHDDWPVPAGSAYNFNIDPSPTKSLMIDRRNQFPKLYEMAFGARPQYELYQASSDPHQVRNLASNPEYKRVLDQLAKQLEEALHASADPRATGSANFEKYREQDIKHSRRKKRAKAPR